MHTPIKGTFWDFESSLQSLVYLTGCMDAECRSAARLDSRIWLQVWQLTRFSKDIKLSRFRNRSNIKKNRLIKYFVLYLDYFIYNYIPYLLQKELANNANLLRGPFTHLVNLGNFLLFKYPIYRLELQRKGMIPLHRHFFNVFLVTTVQ